MRAILDVVLVVLDLYTWVIIASAVISWLVAFNVVNTGNTIVRTIWDMVYRLTEPLLQPIRRFVPQIGGLDLGIFLLQRIIAHYIYPAVF
jgi:YggT family protein